MAKRKRLSPAQSDYLSSESPVLETKSMPLGRAPIAQVAGDSSASAALEALAGEWKEARAQGRLIQAVELDRIEAGWLVRDRIVAEDEELQALMESLKARGQQTPVEVVETGEGRFGLISGWRRLTALRRLYEETGEGRFATVQALLRQPESSSDAYVAMVEENEIRVGLSYYERARVAAKAVEQGVYADEKQALLSLFATASRPKRSKIRSFLTIYHAADDILRFPMAIGERLGLALAKALDEGRFGRTELQAALDGAGAETAAAELSVLEKLLSQATRKKREQETASSELMRNRPMPNGLGELAPGIQAKWSGHSMTLSGPGVSEAFRQKLMAWLRETR